LVCVLSCSDFGSVTRLGTFDLERMQLEGQRLSKFGFQISKYGKVLICNVEDYTKKDV
jgi:hypothetical protein